MAMEKISLEDAKVKSTKSNNNVGKLSNSKSNKKLLTPLLFALVILGGAGLGAYTAKMKISNKPQMEAADVSGSPESSDDIKVGTTFGASDESTFRDSAEGVLVEGGTNGEGSHHLVRQFQDPVYLTSSVVDLDLFVGHKITVWGETFNARHAGWLMDVGRVKVEELNAELPEE